MPARIDPVMLSARRILPSDWETVKAIRLAALRDAPYAFSSTHEEAATRPDLQWRQEAETRSRDTRSTTYLAFAADEPIGMAGAYFDDALPGLVHLVSVWVRADFRGSGAADAVVKAVAVWAAASGGTRMTAWVTTGNTRAERFYNRLGFVTTDPARSHIPVHDQCETLTLLPLTVDTGATLQTVATS